MLSITDDIDNLLNDTGLFILHENIDELFDSLLGEVEDEKKLTNETDLSNKRFKYLLWKPPSKRKQQHYLTKQTLFDDRFCCKIENTGRRMYGTQDFALSEHCSPIFLEQKPQDHILISNKVKAKKKLESFGEEWAPEEELPDCHVENETKQVKADMQRVNKLKVEKRKSKF